MKQVLAYGLLLALGLAGPATGEGKGKGRSPFGHDGRPLPNGTRPGPFGRPKEHTATNESEGFSCGGTIAIVEEETEGPFWLDLNLDRSDIIEDRRGVPLTLTLTVYNTSQCNNDSSTFGTTGSARVDIWHSDAHGNYSGMDSEGTANQTWLRGYQRSDENGIVTFKTIFPGWYEGRTTHIHIRLRVLDGNGGLVYNGTTQLFFQPDVVEHVSNLGEYGGRGLSDTTNDNDPIFSTYTLLNVTGDVEGGFEADANLFYPFISKSGAEGSEDEKGMSHGGMKKNMTSMKEDIKNKTMMKAEEKKNQTKSSLASQIGKRRKGGKKNNIMNMRKN